MIEYDKLVRDKIPEVIETSGKKCDIEVLSDEQYLEYLNKKIKEEVNEYLESGEVEELADLEEVLRAILVVKNVSYDEFEKIRISKVEKRGAFEKKILLKRTYSDGE
jgi:predicted house-cleaning noncanonical NTP pyrophosphatase (MazG superfamily)